MPKEVFPDNGQPSISSSGQLDAGLPERCCGMWSSAAAKPSLFTEPLTSGRGCAGLAECGDRRGLGGNAVLMQQCPA